MGTLRAAWYRSVSFFFKLLLTFTLLFTTTFMLVFWWFYTFSNTMQLNHLRSDLRRTATFAALRIDTDQHNRLVAQGKEDDVDYTMIADKLREVRDAAVGVRGIYTMVRSQKNPQELLFVVSALEDRQERARLFEPYDISTQPQMAAAFDGPISDPEIVIDRWGAWFSGYAPIRDASGNTVAIVGVDLAADDIVALQQQLLWKSVYAFSITYVGLFCLVCLISLQLTRRMRMMHTAVQTLEHGTITPSPLLQQIALYQDEIGQLAQSFQRLMERVHIRERELRVLNEQLGERVEERTTELAKANTELRRAEEALRRINAELSCSNAELVRAVRMKDEFLTSMSHELRTPLNAILGRSDILLEQIHGPLSSRQQHSVRSIVESGRHLLDLINDILDLAKIEASKMSLNQELILLDPICQASIRMVAEQAFKKQVSLSYTFDPAVSHLSADSRRLKQILVNLLSNALKFTPEGGQIGLEVCGDAPAGSVAIKVWDTGIGIAEEDFSRLFQPFVQLDGTLTRQYEGTGLGLALVAELTRLHGGEVTVTSRQGEGSRFVVTLPWQGPLTIRTVTPIVADTTGLEYIYAAESNNGQEPPLILVAEDNIENQELLVDYLTDHGYRVVLAGDGSEAVQQTLALNPVLVLMDIQLPNVDGLTAIRQIRSTPETEQVPIIALTALAMAGDRERCLDAGANDYLSKPIQLQALLHAIHTLRQTNA